MALIIFLGSLFLMLIYSFLAIKTLFIFLTKFKNTKYNFLSSKNNNVFWYTICFFIVNLLPVVFYIIVLFDSSLTFLGILLSTLSLFFYNKFIIISKKGFLTTFHYIRFENIKSLDFISCNYTTNLEVTINNRKKYLFNTFFYTNYYYEILCDYGYGNLFKKTAYNFNFARKLTK